MHPDQGAADIHARVGADLLHRHRVFEVLPAGGGPAAARMGTGHDAHFLPAVLLCGFPLKDDGAVQMLTALRRQPNALFRQHRRSARVQRPGGFYAGILADVTAHHLTGRAAHHEHISLFQLCRSHQLGHCLPCLGLDLFCKCFGHTKNTSLIGLQSAGCLPLLHRNILYFPPDTPPRSCPVQGR